MATIIAVHQWNVPGFAYIRVHAAYARSSSAKYIYHLQGSTFASTGCQRNVMDRIGPPACYTPIIVAPTSAILGHP